MYDCPPTPPPSLDEIHTYSKMLQLEYGYEGDPKDRKKNISLLREWDLLHVLFF